MGRAGRGPPWETAARGGVPEPCLPNRPGAAQTSLRRACDGRARRPGALRRRAQTQGGGGRRAAQVSDWARRRRPAGSLNKPRKPVFRPEKAQSRSARSRTFRPRAMSCSASLRRRRNRAQPARTLRARLWARRAVLMHAARTRGSHARRTRTARGRHVEDTWARSRCVAQRRIQRPRPVGAVAA